jgi:hypothetical protein
MKLECLNNFEIINANIARNGKSASISFQNFNATVFAKRESKNLDLTISSDQPDQICNHRIFEISWGFGIFGSSLGKIFRILGYLGQGFGDFWVGFGTFRSCLGWDFLGFGCLNPTQNPRWVQMYVCMS